MVSDDKYIKLPSNSKAEVFRIVGERVMRKEVIFSHYSCDVFFYLILK